MISCNARPYEGTDAYVFFSYPRKDAGIVYPLIERLASEGCRIWFDAGIHVGEDWPDVIADHLYHAEACIAFLSETAISSHNCKNELNYAIELKKPLIPVRYNDAALTKGIQMMLANIQWMSVRDVPTAATVSEILNHPSVKKCQGIPDRSIVIQDYQTDIVEKPKEERPAFDPGISPDQPAGDKPSDPSLQTGDPQLEADANKSRETGQVISSGLEETMPENPPEPALTPENESFSQDSMESQIDQTPVKPPVLSAEEQATESKYQSRHERRRRTSALTASGNFALQNSEEDPLQKSGSMEMFSAEEIEGDPLEETIAESAFDLDKTVAVTSEFPPVIVHLSHGRKFLGVSNGSVTLGRKKEKSQIQITDPENTISGAHIKVISMNGVHMIKDLNSTNGTWVDGEKLEKEGEVQVEGCCEVRLFKERVFIAFDPLAKSLWEAKALLSLRCEDTGETRYLWQNEMKLGRHHKWNFGVFDDKKVGREHAVILATDDGFILKDKSMNGTWLNRERMQKEAEARLTNGDVIQIGNWHFIVSVIILEGESEK